MNALIYIRCINNGREGTSRQTGSHPPTGSCMVQASGPRPSLSGGGMLLFNITKNMKKPGAGWKPPGRPAPTRPRGAAWSGALHDTLLREQSLCDMKGGPCSCEGHLPPPAPHEREKGSGT